MQIAQLSDRNLVTLALLKNQGAFSHLMQRHKDSLCAYIQHQFSTGDATEDLLLIIFDKAFRKLNSYDAQFAFTTWLYTIADNTCIDFVRKQKTLAQTFRRVSYKYDQHISAPSDPESELIASQEAALLIRYINRLKPIYRDPFRLRYLHNFAYEEIANELSLPANTVKVRLHRAKEILRKWIIQS